MATKASRGELFWLDWSPGRGSQQLGVRPALIICTNAAGQNPRYNCVIVATVSTRGSAEIASHVPVMPSDENGLRELSYVKCEQIQTVSKGRLLDRIGSLSNGHMATVDATLKRVLALV